MAVGLRDSISNAGDQDAIISDAVEDDDGDYIFTNGKYVYFPKTADDGEDRYQVSFQNDNKNGEYARRISADGHLYFEYVRIENRSEIVDLYSPFRRWSNPVNHEIFQLAGNVNLSKNTIADWDVSVSNLDKNTFSTLNDDDNVGIAHNISINGKEISVFENAQFGYNITNWSRSNQFRAISRERNAQFNRDWNIQSEDESQESLFSSGFNFKNDESFNSKFDWSQYNSTFGKRNRLTGQVSSSTKFVPKFDSYINRVKSEKSNYYQLNIDGMLLPGNFHPIVSYKGEYEKDDHKFDIGKLGLLFTKENKNIAASITRRIDYKNE